MKGPEKTYRIGLVSAAVFVNEIEVDGKARLVRSVSLQRRYRDASDNEWKSTTSFSLAELPQAITALKLAMDHMASQESESNAS